jgi:hypothetical protein
MEWTELNSICDGTGQLNIKGSNIDLDGRPSVVVFIGTNRTPEELFTRTNATKITIEAFHARFNIVWLFNGES